MNAEQSSVQRMKIVDQQNSNINKIVATMSVNEKPCQKKSANAFYCENIRFRADSNLINHSTEEGNM